MPEKQLVTQLPAIMNFGVLQDVKIKVKSTQSPPAISRTGKKTFIFNLLSFYLA